jgi:Arc/MetJ-type ribon-helix-helix transcriptional regulator
MTMRIASCGSSVHGDAARRTQVYLGDDEFELLDRVRRATGASRSELIRRAVRRTFGEKTKAEKLQALKASAGSWRDRRFTGAEYVDTMRDDVNERLRRLGLD